MKEDNALTNLEVLWISKGGDTGKRRAEHRSLLQSMFTHDGL